MRAAVSTPPAAARTLLEERFGPPDALAAERVPTSPEADRRRAALLSIPTPGEQAAHRRALRAALREEQRP